MRGQYRIWISGITIGTTPSEHHATRGAKLRLAEIIEELILYAETRDKALSKCVAECALLRAELEVADGRTHCRAEMGTAPCSRAEMLFGERVTERDVSRALRG